MEIEDTMRLLSEILHKAVSDYLKWRKTPPSKPRDREYFATASSMLWDDDYLMQWGEREISLEEICQVLGFDVFSLRRHLKEREDNGFDYDWRVDARGERHSRGESPNPFFPQSKDHLACEASPSTDRRRANERQNRKASL